jgi:hypothetical protein
VFKLELQNVLRFNAKTLAANCFKASPITEDRTNTQHQAKLEGTNDARTGMPHGIPRGAMCVQRFDDSLNSAIHTTYRISLRSSSMPEPRDPLLKVVIIMFVSDADLTIKKVLSLSNRRASPPRKHECANRQG